MPFISLIGNNDKAYKQWWSFSFACEFRRPACKKKFFWPLIFRDTGSTLSLRGKICFYISWKLLIFRHDNVSWFLQVLKNMVLKKLKFVIQIRYFIWYLSISFRYKTYRHNIYEKENSFLTLNVISINVQYVLYQELTL